MRSVTKYKFGLIIEFISNMNWKLIKVFSYKLAYNRIPEITISECDRNKYSRGRISMCEGTEVRKRIFD